MASTNAAPIKGTIIRIVQEDVCGIPVTGASSHVIITNLFTQVQMTPQYEDGTDFFERTADGVIGVNQKDPPILKRMQMQTDLLAVDPDMMPYVISARELVTSAPVSGWGFGLSEGPSSAHYSLEVWQRVAGAGACTPGGLAQYIYNAWPHCYNTQVMAYTISNARSTLSFQCDTAAANAAWGDGPGTGTSYLPASGTTTALTTEHWLWNITTVTPPVAAVGASLLT
jgi:hypothetical protein